MIEEKAHEKGKSHQSTAGFVDLLAKGTSLPFALLEIDAIAPAEKHVFRAKSQLHSEIFPFTKHGGKLFLVWKRAFWFPH